MFRFWLLSIVNLSLAGFFAGVVVHFLYGDHGRDLGTYWVGKFTFIVLFIVLSLVGSYFIAGWLL